MTKLQKLLSLFLFVLGVGKSKQGDQGDLGSRFFVIFMGTRPKK
jgi:hypothetical protein